MFFQVFEDSMAAKSVVRMHVEEVGFASRRKKPGRYGKYIIFDFDDVFNMYGTDSPIKSYLSYLTDGRIDGLRQIKDKIFRSVMSIERGKDPAVHGEAVSRRLREGGLSEGVHYEICEKVSNEFVPAKSLSRAVEVLNGMGYSPYVLSASPRELVFSCDAAGSIPIPEQDVYATDFVFKDGRFSSMDLNMGEARRLNRDSIVDGADSFRLEIMVDDNPDTGRRMLRPGSYVNFWLKGPAPKSDNFNIVDYSIRDDFDNLVERLRRIDRGFDVVKNMDESSYSAAAECARSGVEYGKLALKSEEEEFSANKDRAVLMMSAYDAKMGSTSFCDRRIMSKIAEVGLEDRKIMCADTLKEIVDIFDSECLESRVDPSFLEEYLPAS